MTLVTSEWSDSVSFQVTSLGSAFEEMAKLLPPDSLNVSGWFGRSVALDQTGRVLAVGAAQDGSNGTNSGSVYLFDREGTVWTHRSKIVGDSPTSNRRFGTSVSLSGNGEKLAVGAYEEGTGFVYIFELLEGAWVQTQKFTAHNAVTGTGFGFAVALSGDGETLAVSTNGESRFGTTAGAVYMYRLGPSGFEPTSIVYGPNPKDGLYFGSALTLSGDARFMAVAEVTATNVRDVVIYEQVQGFWLYRTKLHAPRHQNGEATISGLSFDYVGDYLVMGTRLESSESTESGAAFMYRREGDQWVLKQQLKALDAEAIDSYGVDVAIAGDASWLIAGAYREDTSGSDVGAIYALNRIKSGLVQTGQTKGTNTSTETYVYFSRTGRRAAVGTRLENSGRGRVYCFEKDNDGIWVQTQVLNPPTAQNDSHFGHAVEFYDDDQFMIISHTNYNGSSNNQGRLYIYALTNNTWVYTGGIVNNHSPSNYRNYGRGISVSADGQIMLTGARNTAATIAHCFYFIRNGASWTYQGLINRTLTANDGFGHRSAISSDGTHALILAAAPVSGYPGGKLYYFTRSGSVWTEQQVLVPEDVANGEVFHSSVEISADGYDAYVVSKQGNATYVNRYERTDSTWTFISRMEIGNHSVINYGRLTRHFDLEGEMLVGLLTDSTGVFQTYRDPEIYSVANHYTLRSKLLGYDSNGVDKFGGEVAISQDGQYLAVASVFDDEAPQKGAVYVYRRSGGNWHLLTKFANTRNNSSSASSDNQVIFSLAFNSDASQLYLGLAADGETGESSGAVAVYGATSEARDCWTYQYRITAPDAATYNAFGASVTLSHDGNYLIVSATNNAAVVPGGGKVYVYRQINEEWVYETSITPNDLEANDGFGTSLAINNDGSYLFAAAAAEDAAGTNVGAVYIFTRSGTVWTQQAKLLPPGPLSNNLNYGYSLATNSTATLLVVGTAYDDVYGADAGTAFIYDRNPSNGWDYRCRLYAPDARAGHGFGADVSMDADGATLIVGARDDNDRSTKSGAVYTYVLGESDFSEDLPNFVQVQKVWPEQQGSDRFGQAVSVSKNGNHMLVGRPSATVSGNAGAGVVDYYEWDGSWWNYISTFQANDVEAGAAFGSAISMNSTGTVAMIAADQHDGAGVNAGAVYYFTRSGQTWTQIQRFYSNSPVANEYFGRSLTLSMNGDYVAIGVPEHDGNGSNSGLVKIFALSGDVWSHSEDIISGTWVASDYAGYDVAFNADADRLMIGVPGASINDLAGAGAVDVFARSGSVWSFHERLLPPVIKAGYGYGGGLAINSVGDVLFVRQTIDTVSSPAGIHVHRFTGSTWEYRVKLLPDDSLPMNGVERKGLSTTSSGEYIFMGAPSDSDYGTNAGAVYVFKNNVYAPIPV